MRGVHSIKRKIREIREIRKLKPYTNKIKDFYNSKTFFTSKLEFGIDNLPLNENRKVEDLKSTKKGYDGKSFTTLMEFMMLL